MDIALLTGAYVNAGDFLIEQRAEELLKHVIKDVNIYKYKRNDVYKYINDINDMKVAVFCGGPIYLKNLEKYITPLGGEVRYCARQYENIKVPFMIMGGGWYGKGSSNNLVFNYNFSEWSKLFFGNIDINGYGLGCRDLLTYNVLKSEGFKNIFMTGCPAWYSVKHVNINKICDEVYNIITISDPANKEYYNIVNDLIDYIGKNFPKTKIKFVFHRGRIVSNKKYIKLFYEKIIEKGIELVNIENSAEGFKVYDNSDLHIGFRVHAHIYNLSIRHKSILIEEDGRGSGVNSVLGLVGIKAYNESIQVNEKFINKFMYLSGKNINNNCIKEIDGYLNLLYSTDFQYMNNAFVLMQKYYKIMIRYLEQLKV